MKRRTLTSLLSAVVLLGTWAFATNAQAQRRDNGRMTIRADVGVLGHSELIDEDNPDNRVRESLDETFGMSLALERPFHRHGWVGFQLGAHGWRPETNDDFRLHRNVYVDADFLPTLRVPFQRDPHGSAFYAGGVLGFTGAFLRDDYSNAFARASHGFGIHAGLRAGVEILVHRGGIVAEFGYDVRVTRHRVDRPVFNDDAVALVFRQPRFSVGFVTRY